MWHVALIFFVLGVMSTLWISSLVKKSTPNNPSITQKPNSSLEELATEKKIRTGEVRNMIEYQWKKEDMQRQFSNLRGEVEKKKKEKEEIDNKIEETQTELNEKEAKLKMIQHKINEINELLSLFKE
jgi:peptidoglycan hydrolase CwlO-like protein